MMQIPLIPAHAGTQASFGGLESGVAVLKSVWVPAFAGMSSEKADV